MDEDGWTEDDWLGELRMDGSWLGELRVHGKWLVVGRWVGGWKTCSWMVV